MARPSTYKKNPNKDRKYKLSRGETPTEMVERLFKRGRSINFITKKVPGMTVEKVTDIVKNNYKTRRLWKQEELKIRIAAKETEAKFLRRSNNDFRKRIREDRDRLIREHKEKLEKHFEKRLRTALKRQFREHDYRVRKNLKVKGIYGTLYFHKELEHDFLKLSITAFPFIMGRYELSREELDMMLLLHGEGVFEKEAITDRDDIPKMFVSMKTKGLINTWRTDSTGKAWYKVSGKSESIINELYSYMTGEAEIYTSKLKKDKKSMALANFLKKVNSSIS